LDLKAASLTGLDLQAMSFTDTFHLASPKGYRVYIVINPLTISPVKSHQALAIAVIYLS
jgi:hypothetical protein